MAFHARTGMKRVTKNYGQSQNFPVCKIDAKDSKPHFLVSNNSIVDQVPIYEDLFSNKLKKQVNLVQNLHTNFLRRLKILEKENWKKTNLPT